jgi:hypothetical protein
MEDNGAEIERIDGEDGKQTLRVKKIPLEELLTILENLYEAGTNYIDIEFYIDPKEIQSVITISTCSEYMASPEELEEERLLDESEEDDDEDEDDDIMDQIKKQQDIPDIEPLSDDELNELM